MFKWIYILQSFYTFCSENNDIALPCLGEFWVAQLKQLVVNFIIPLSLTNLKKH